MSSSDSVSCVLMQYVCRHHPTFGELDVGTDMLESGQLDSLMVMDFVTFIQSRFAVEIPPEDITPANMRTIARLSAYVEKRLAQNRNAA